MGLIVPVLSGPVCVDLSVHAGPAWHRAGHVRQLGRGGGELLLQDGQRGREGGRKRREGRGEGEGLFLTGLRVVGGLWLWAGRGGGGGTFRQLTQQRDRERKTNFRYRAKTAFDSILSNKIDQYHMLCTACNVTNVCRSG